MSEARSAILANIRKSLNRGPLTESALAAITARLSTHPRNLIPARGQEQTPSGRIELFRQMAREAAATVACVADDAEVPGAIADYLRRENLPSAVRIARDPPIRDLPWHNWPTIKLSEGRAEDADLVSVTAAFGAVAETGSLILLSSPESPTTLNLMPDTHVVVLQADQVAGFFEEIWDRLRQRQQARAERIPRTVNIITGPSRSADIEQKLQLGAHGPRRLHIVLVGPPAAAAA